MRPFLTLLALLVLNACGVAGASSEDSARLAADTVTIPGTAAPVELARSDTASAVVADGKAERRSLVMLPSWAAEWQGDDAALRADGQWLGLVVDRTGARLTSVPVRRNSVENVCFSEDTTTVFIDQLEVDAPGAVFALWGETSLNTGPVVQGTVLDHGEFSAFSVPDEGGHTGSSARAVFAGDTLRFRQEAHGEGFRLIVRWRDADEVLYETETQDEGSWNVRWVGDLDRDEVPDILLDATWKYSLDATWLHLSGGTSHGSRWRAVARYQHAAC
jgi:hypothetical protein